MSVPASQATGRTLASLGDMKLAVPDCERGIGTLIQSPDSEHLIAGLKVQAFQMFPDDRGYFLEVHRMGRGLASDFPPESTQISAALSYPGTIKAFHYHLHQHDCWAPVQGMLQVALVDFRTGSPTFGVRNTMYVGALRPWQILIPPGVGHGYKIIGRDAAMLVYLTDRFYNPKDEGRVAHDDAGINYDWETQHK